jgi:hypothetical protein
MGGLSLAVIAGLSRDVAWAALGALTLAAGVWGVVEQANNKVERARAQLFGDILAGKIVLDEMDTETETVFRDSLIDLMNYAAIALAVWDGEWTADMKMEGTK